MTEKRKATEALFRQKIKEAMKEFPRAFPGRENDFLAGARFAIRTLRELEAAEREKQSCP